jgi:hypothetical protein
MKRTDFWASCLHTYLCHTDPVQKNLTLTVDADVLKAARKAALDRDTSVNQMVRDYLAELARDTGERRSAREDLKKFFRTHSVTIGRRTWTRDDLHKRRWSTVVR